MPSDFFHGVEVIPVINGTRSINAKRFSIAGIIGTAPDADPEKYPLNTPIKIFNARQAQGLGEAGTLAKSLDGFYDNGGGVCVLVRVAQGESEAQTLANVQGRADQLTGVHAFKAAESQIKITPRILAAPGFTHQRPDDKANPIIAELKGIARSLRAIFVADGPNTTDAAAIQAAQDIGSERGYLVDPWVSVFDPQSASTLIEPASARIAGLMVRVDTDYGFWFSPSNHPVNGITGLGRPVVHERSNRASQTNLLNEKKVSTIIHNNGFRLWGNRGTGQEPSLDFISVVRTYDSVDTAVENALDWASDKPESAQLVLDVGETIDNYLRELRAAGALLGGQVWFDPELNTKESLSAGRVYLNYDREAAAPLERLTLIASNNNEYYAPLIDQITTAFPLAA